MTDELGPQHFLRLRPLLTRNARACTSCSFSGAGLQAPRVTHLREASQRRSRTNDVPETLPTILLQRHISGSEKHRYFRTNFCRSSGSRAGGNVPSTSNVEALMVTLFGGTRSLHRMDLSTLLVALLWVSSQKRPRRATSPWTQFKLRASRT